MLQQQDEKNHIPLVLVQGHWVKGARVWVIKSVRFPRVDLTVLHSHFMCSIRFLSRVCVCIYIYIYICVCVCVCGVLCSGRGSGSLGLEV